MSDVAKRIEGLSPAKRRALRQRLVKKKNAVPKAAIPRRPRGRRPLPLAFGQERLWFIAELEPESGVYNTFYALRLRGELAVPALDASFLDVVGRHESLRTTFAAPDGRPIQVVHAPPPALPLPVVALERLAAADREAAVKRLVPAAAAPVFDLERGPLLRPVLLRLAPQEHVLVVVIHHIISDGWSLGVLVRELAACYQARTTGRPAPLPELAIQYADFALWQRQWLAGKVLEEQLAYWRQQLAGAPPRLELPCDRPRALRRSYRGTTLGLRLTPELTAALRTLSAEHGSTLFATLLTAFAVLLGRTSGQSDLVVGSPVANRQRTELEDLIGFLLNTLALRIDLGGDSPFTELLGRVREVTLDAFAHQDLPFAKVVEELQPERDMGQTPFYQVMFVLQSAPPATFRIPGLEIEPLDNEDQPEDLDFSLFLFPEEDGLRGRLRYSVELYDASTIRRLLERFQVLLEEIVAAPERPLSGLSAHSAAERHQLLAEWNDTLRPPRFTGCLPEEIAAQVERSPEAVAVAFGDAQLSYRELQRRTARLAQRLRKLGVTPEEVVGLFVERSLELLVGALGILKAGASYLPLDPAYPRERLAFMIEDSGARMVVGREKGPALLSGSEAGVEMVLVDGDGDEDGDGDGEVGDLAYVIYTSGSTGKPKGVEITHRTLMNFLGSMVERPGLQGDDVLVAVTSLAFDISTLELYGPLLVGARVELVGSEEAADGTALRDRLRRSRATVMQATPATWRLLVTAGWDEADELRVLCGGEALPGALAAELVARSREVWNLYGPTETTVWSAVARVGEEAAHERRGAEAATPIGRGIANTRIHLFDRRLRPVPIGVPGELGIGGDGLARGYRGRPALTAEKFVPDPNAREAGRRLYRTGDLARTLADGGLDFLGRIDHQIKLRGHRIELGEIEARLEGHPQVAQTAVVVAGERLVAYLVPAGDSPPGVEQLRGFLREEVPEYMVPSLYVSLESLPLTPNRKVDRRALPAPETARPDLETAYLPPTTELEKQLAAIWQEVLGLERVGLDDNFFDVGGHSLLLAQVRARVNKLTGGEVPLMELFRRPNIRSLAAFLGGGEAPREARRPAPAGVRGERRGGEIAIVGMSARYAGAASVEEFWDNLCGGVESIRRLSEEELEAAGVDPEIYRAPDYVPACADLRDPDRFDAAFFGFNPREAEILDPQHRVLLECAWEALENAGYDPGRYPGRVGVFAGSGMSRYAMNVFSNPEMVRSLGMAPLMFAVGQDFLAPRISYKLNLTGPSMVVQTACSTALTAVHLARQALAEGNCDMALAGGVTLLEHPPQGYRFLEGGIQSSDGHCRAFDAAAEGMVSSSGAGVVVLKRLADAVAGGDRIHAVVKATAINNDGAVKVGFTAPSEEGQEEVIREALEAAGVEPETIGYIEAHGTATALGDPIEVAALTRVFGQGAVRRGSCGLGSVKTNIGHADTAAGAAGLIKAALAVERGLLPPSLHFEQPNPAIDFAATPFYVPTELRPWDHAGTPRRAGVSAFGIGGTNVHVVLEQAPATEPSGPSRRWQLLVLSAATATALDAVTARLADDLEADPEKDLADVAFTCQMGRRRLLHRRTLVVDGRRQALAALAAAAGWEYVAEAVEDRNQRSVVFLCSGLGEQYPGMGRELYAGEPVFRDEVDRCCALLEPLLGLDLRQVIYPEEKPVPERQAASGPDLRRLLRRGAEPESEAHRRLSETRLLQPAVFVIEVALARLLRAWGIVPRALVGYSLGEYTAAYLAGVLELEEALTLVAQRAELISTLPGGAMTAVALPEAEVEAYLGPELALAASNAPAVSVLAGSVEAIARCEEQLAAGGHVYQRLRTRHAFHSPMMEPIVAALGERVRRLHLRPPEIPYLSNVTGTWITAGEATDPDYWVRHLCRPVRFAEGLRELLHDPEPVLLEVGPGQALATAARQHPERPTGKVVLATLRDERERHPDQAFLLRTLGQLWGAGLEIDWNGFYAGERRRRLALPTYPFERRRFWIEPGRQALAAAAGPPPLRKQEDLADWFYTLSWQPSALTEATESDRRWLLLVDECGLGTELAEQLTAAGRLAITVRPGEEFARLGPASYALRPAERSDYEALIAELGRDGGIPQHWVHLWSVTGPAIPEAAARPDPSELGFYSLISQMQALGGEGPGEPMRLAVVSDGIQATGRGEALWPEKAAVLGPCKVIPIEYPNVRCSSIDVALDGSGDLAGLAAQLLAELRAGLPDPIVAYREGVRMVQGHETLRLEAAQERPELPQRGVFLILGGLGGMGGVVASYLAESYEARLVLTGRSPVPAREQWDPWLAGHDEDDPTHSRIRELLVLEELGAEVVVEQADVADEAAMRGVVERTRARFGALDAVFHIAGVAGGGVIQLKQRAVAAEVLRSKLEGMRVLEAVLADEPPQLLMLFSSINSLIGVFAQTDYCAANNVLDAFARKWQRERPELRCVAVNWGQWKEVGMGVEAERDSERGRAMLENLGISPAEGVEAIERILCRHRGAEIVVSAADLGEQLAIQERARQDPYGFERALAAMPGPREQHARPDLSTPYAAPTNDTEKTIAEIWHTLLGIEQVGIHDNFLELGGNSLIGVQLIARLRESFDVQLSMEEVFAALTVADMAARIADRDQQEDRNQLDQLLREVEEMSLNEVEGELRERQR